MIADSIDLTAPLPLGYVQAVNRGLALRERGNAWTFTVIADVVRVYHGFDRSAGWWQRELRSRGAAARPHGIPLNGSVAA